MLRFLCWLANFTVYSAAVVAGVLVVLLMLGVCVEVLSRQFLGFSYPLIMDFAEGSLLLITFLAAAWVLRQEAHVRVDVFVKLLPRRRREVLDALIGFISGCVMLVVTLVGVNETLKDIRLDRIFGGSMLYMRWWMSIAIPVGAGLMTLAYFVRSWESIRRGRASGEPVEAKEKPSDSQVSSNRRLS